MIRDEVRYEGDIMGELEGESTERVGQVSHLIKSGTIITYT